MKDWYLAVGIIEIWVLVQRGWGHRPWRPVAFLLSRFSFLPYARHFRLLRLSARSGVQKRWPAFTYLCTPSYTWGWRLTAARCQSWRQTWTLWTTTSSSERHYSVVPRVLFFFIALTSAPFFSDFIFFTSASMCRGCMVWHWQSKEQVEWCRETLPCVLCPRYQFGPIQYECTLFTLPCYHWKLRLCVVALQLSRVCNRQGLQPSSLWNLTLFKMTKTH